MTEYQGNSNTEKEGPNSKPRKNLERVVKGEVVVQKPGVAKRFKSIFFGGDARTAGQYLLGEVLIPAVRNLAVELINKGTDQMVYGRDRRPPASRSSYTPRVQYHNPVYRSEPRGYVPPNRPLEAGRWVKMEDRPTVENIVVASKADADAILENLANVLDSYDEVTVADLYDLIGAPSTHVDHTWGWTRLNTVSVRQVKDGYHISLPRVEAL